MERERSSLESAAVSYAYFKGLYAIPGGLLAIVAALGNWGWGPLQSNWVFLGVIALIGAACMPIARYYDAHYGRATLSTRDQVRAGIVVAAGAPLVFGTSLLLRSRAAWSLDLPVWNGSDPSNIGLLLAGVAFIVAGILDHRTLVRTFGPGNALRVGHGNAGA